MVSAREKVQDIYKDIAFMSDFSNKEHQDFLSYDRSCKGLKIQNTDKRCEYVTQYLENSKKCGYLSRDFIVQMKVCLETKDSQKLVDKLCEKALLAYELKEADIFMCSFGVVSAVDGLKAMQGNGFFSFFNQDQGLGGLMKDLENVAPYFKPNKAESLKELMEATIKRAEDVLDAAKNLHKKYDNLVEICNDENSDSIFTQDECETVDLFISSVDTMSSDAKKLLDKAKECLVLNNAEISSFKECKAVIDFDDSLTNSINKCIAIESLFDEADILSL